MFHLKFGKNKIMFHQSKDYLLSSIIDMKFNYNIVTDTATYITIELTKGKRTVTINMFTTSGSYAIFDVLDDFFFIREPRMVLKDSDKCKQYINELLVKIYNNLQG